MRQEKWDEFHKKIDEALDSEFGKAKVALRGYLLENKEQVAADLEEMREKSNNTKETLEEAAIKYATETNGVIVNQRKKQQFTEGAKWQAERMYSEEDMREAFENGVGSGKYQAEYGDNAKGSMNFEYFIEQFKKK